MPKQQLPQHVKDVLLKRFKEDQTLNEHEQAIIDNDILGDNTEVDPSDVVYFIADNTTWTSWPQSDSLFRRLIIKMNFIDFNAEALIQGLSLPLGL